MGKSIVHEPLSNSKASNDQREHDTPWHYLIRIFMICQPTFMTWGSMTLWRLWSGYISTNFYDLGVRFSSRWCLVSGWHGFSGPPGQLDLGGLGQGVKLLRGRGKWQRPGCRWCWHRRPWFFAFFFMGNMPIIDSLSLYFMGIIHNNPYIIHNNQTSTVLRASKHPKDIPTLETAAQQTL